jgi:hypothetical protein
MQARLRRRRQGWRCRTGRLCSLRLSVRTPPFHGGESGSIPLGSAKSQKSGSPQSFDRKSGVADASALSLPGCPSGLRSACTIAHGPWAHMWSQLDLGQPCSVRPTLSSLPQKANLPANPNTPQTQPPTGLYFDVAYAGPPTGVPVGIGPAKK